jgi:hypothetical protein
MGLVFVPAKENSYARLKGQLLLTPSSKRLGEVAKMYINDVEVPIVDGIGVVDFPRTQLTRKSRDLHAVVRVDSSEFSTEIDF